MTDRIDAWGIATTLYRQAVETGDFKSEGAHQIELSPWMERELQMYQHHWTFAVNPTDRKFWGLFEKVTVAEPLDEAVLHHECGPDCTHTVTDFVHCAIRLERMNGRFAYFDWEGNRKELT